MRADNNKWQMNKLLFYNEIIRQKVEQNIQKCICASANSIFKRLNWKKPLKWSVQPVNKLIYIVPDKLQLKNFGSQK